MSGTPVFFMSFFFPLVLFLIVAAVFLFAIVRAIAGAIGSRNASRMSADETRMLQDLAASLEKMEKRIENLETIVIDRARKSEFEKL
ncbi:phage shock protein B [bacterium]|nr:phage shock protein B [bacterium]